MYVCIIYICAASTVYCHGNLTSLTNLFFVQPFIHLTSPLIFVPILGKITAKSSVTQVFMKAYITSFSKNMVPIMPPKVGTFYHCLYYIGEIVEQFVYQELY